MLDEPDFVSTRLMLQRGDSLVLYTDGIVEAADAHGRLYGDERLQTTLTRAGANPQNISAAVLRSLEQFSRDAAANDDLTLFICHRNFDR